MRYRRVSYRYAEVVRRVVVPTPGALWPSRGWSALADPSWRPPTDVYETPSGLVAKVELAGMSEDDIEVAVYADTLVVQGVRQSDSLPGEARYHAAEIRYGHFRVEVPLPCPVEADRAAARYERGFLTVEFPRCPEGDR